MDMMHKIDIVKAHDKRILLRKLRSRKEALYRIWEEKFKLFQRNIGQPFPACAFITEEDVRIEEIDALIKVIQEW